MTIRPTLVGFGLVLLAVCPAAAQQVPNVELSGGYALLNAGVETYAKGYFVDVVANVNSWLGIVGATDASYRTRTFEYLLVGRNLSGTVIRARVPVTVNTTVRGFVLGMRVGAPRDTRVRLFGQVLGGGVHVSALAEIDPSAESAAALRDLYSSSATRLAVQAGGGANIIVSSRVGARVGLDYRRLERVQAKPVLNGDNGDGPNHLRFTIGIVWGSGR